MQIPGLHFLRRQLFTRLGRNLAALLGLFQALIAHWLWSAALAQPSGGVAVWLGAALALAVANGATVPVLQRARRGEGRARRLAGFYMETGVAGRGGGPPALA